MTVGVSRHVPIAFRMTQAEIGRALPAQKRTAAIGRRPAGMGALVQVRRVRTKFWPEALVQLSWLVETIRQLKLTGVWRISEVPLICTEVAPVIV